jgi:hypothetical protein
MPASIRSSFVTVMAAISLALGGLGVLSNLMQLLLAGALPAEGLAAGLLPPDTPVPAPLLWLNEHLVGLSLAGALLSAVLAWVSWGMLRRREWARRAFITGLILAALANFAGLPLLDNVFGSLVDSMAGADAADLDQLRAMTHTLQQALFWCGLVGAVMIAAVHGWIAWRLCSPKIRAEFQDDSL